MTRLRTVGLALVAASAMGAFAVPAAFAAPPEFGGPFPKTFTSKSGGSTFQTPKNGKVKCKGDTDKGEITGPKQNKETITFTGCERNGAKCTSAGAAEGEVKTTELDSILVRIGHETVGVQLKPKEKAPFAEFECKGLLAPEKIRITGSVIGIITPLDMQTTIFKVDFDQKKGVQEITEYEDEEGKKVKAEPLEMEGRKTEEKVEKVLFKEGAGLKNDEKLEDFGGKKEKEEIKSK